jgi:hypothetical protein
VIDWFWSTAVYGGALVALAGAAGLVWPLRWLHGKSRKRALLMLAASVATAIGLTRITPALATSAGRERIDEFAPAFHFREHHSTIVTAPPDRVFAAIKAVSADEIALFRTFTAIRRFGRSAPESILNPSGGRPILDVATSTGFLLLAEQAPRELVVGAVVVAPPGTRRPQEFTSDHFRALDGPGYAKATMNFLVQDLGNGTSRLDTETRVVATNDEALRRFTPYWRIIFPGSTILRYTWLSAIKARAERPSP